MCYQIIQVCAQAHNVVRAESGSGSCRMRSGREDESSLVEAVQQGDLTAFEALFLHYKGRVYSLCYRLVSDTGIAEDLTQEVFLLVYRKIHAFRGECAFSTWLHRVAVNTALMHLRRKTDMLQELPPDGPQVGSSLQTEATTELNLDRIHMDRSIAALPPGYRAVFVLHDVEGYDHEEIAKYLGCTPGTSKSQLHKARLKLRELLKG